MLPSAAIVHSSTSRPVNQIGLFLAESAFVGCHVVPCNTSVCVPSKSYPVPSRFWYKCWTVYSVHVLGAHTTLYVASSTTGDNAGVHPSNTYPVLLILGQVYSGVVPYSNNFEIKNWSLSFKNVTKYSLRVDVYSATYTTSHTTSETSGVQRLNTYLYWTSAGLVGLAGLTIFPLAVP